MKKFLFLFILMVSILIGCREDPYNDTSSEPTYFDVKYEVTGTTSKVDITIENESGGTSQFSDVSVPWIYEFRRISGSFVYLSAQNQLSSGSVTVTIYKNGNVFKSSSSSGAYVIATAYGTL